MSEVELIAKYFITRVDHVKVYPINHEAYEQSQHGVEREINRLKGKLARAHRLEKQKEIRIKIEKLKLIEKYLQKALEL